MKDNQKNNKADDGFEAFDDLGADDVDMSQELDVSGDLVDDIDYSDLGDDNDADVFAEDANTEAPKKKSGTLFNVIVFGSAALIAAGFIGFNLLNKGDTAEQAIQPSVTADVSGADIAAGTASDASAQQAVQDAVNGENVGVPAETSAMGGLLDNPDQLTAVAPAPVVPPIQAAPQPVLVDPFSGLETASAPVPMPAPIVPEEASVPAVSSAPSEPQAVVTTAEPFPPLVSGTPVPEAPSAVMPEQVAAAPTVPVVPAPQLQMEAQPQIQLQSQPQVSPQVATTEPVATNTENESSTIEFANLNDKLTALNARLDALTQQMSTIATTAAAVPQPSSPATPSPEVKALEAQLSRLESRLETLSTQASQNNDSPEPTPVARKAKPKASSTKTENASTPKKAESAWDKPFKPQSTGKARLGADVSVVAKAAPVQTATAPVPVPQAIPTAAGGWRLQGAQPGRAILGNTSGDIREVGVGDSVPGLGRVTTIGQIGGQWVVQATGGAVSQ